jgi:hypothetical protein
MNHTIMHAMVAGFFAAGIATSAFAADPAASLMSFDTDRNDSVSHAEFVSALKQRFDNMDKNANGKVTSSELRGFAMKQMMGSTRDPIFSRQQSRPDLPSGDHAVPLRSGRHRSQPDSFGGGNQRERDPLNRLREALTDAMRQPHAHAWTCQHRSTGLAASTGQRSPCGAPSGGEAMMV